MNTLVDTMLMSLAIAYLHIARLLGADSLQSLNALLIFLDSHSCWAAVCNVLVLMYFTYIAPQDCVLKRCTACTIQRNVKVTGPVGGVLL